MIYLRKMRWFTFFAVASSIVWCVSFALAQDEEGLPAGELGIKAIQNFERAAADGNLQALVRLGEIYQEGRLVDADPVKALTYFETAAARGSPAGKLRLAEAYLAGTGVPLDAGLALGLLHEAAESGESRASVRLGDAYAAGAVVPFDPNKALDYYEQAAASGNTQALLRLAEAYRDGRIVAASLPVANRYYQRAADKGSRIAKARLGEALVRGRGVIKDVKAGLAMVRDAAEEGEPVALYLMGEFLSRGEFVPTDALRGIDYYERSATAGYALGYLRLGEIYRDGVIAEATPAKSIAYYEKAAKLGLSRAMVLLGENYANKRYGSGSDVQAGVDLIREALSKGEPTAAPSLANLYLWGVGLPQNVNTALSTLTEAADAGNILAAKLLISYFRDGRQSLIERNVGKATRLLKEYSVLFSKDELTSDELLLASATARTPKDFEHVSAQITQMAPAARTAIVSALRTANPNLFVYVVQARLNERGLYSGPLNGRLTPETIRAVQKLCKESLVEQFCKKGPLSPEAATFVAQLIG